MPHFPKPFFRQSRQLWYVQIDGQQINLGPQRDEAFRHYHALMANPKISPSPPSSNVLVVELADLFLDWVRHNRSVATFEWYRLRLQQFAVKFPTLTASALRPYHVDQWASDAGGSVTTRRNRLRSVKRCLSWAKRQGYIDANPIEALEVPCGGQKETYVSPAEFARLLNYATNKHFADLLKVTYASGCRPQELLRVEARHVDLPHSRWVFPRTEAKGRQMPRIVYLTGEALSISQQLVERYSTGTLFRNSKGRAWTKDSVGCAFDRLCVRMAREVMDDQSKRIDPEEIDLFVQTLNPHRTTKGQLLIKTTAELRSEAKQKILQHRARNIGSRYSLYSLRHSWATNALQRGVDALTVAILMGHKDPSTLARVYQHLSHSPEHLLDQARLAAG